MPRHVQSLRDMVTETVRDATEPLTVEQILRVGDVRRLVTSSNPKTSIRNALQNSPLVESLGDGRYVYAPRAATGSSFRILLDGVEESRPFLPVGDEVAACLVIDRDNPWEDHAVSLRLAGGPVIAGTLRWTAGPYAALDLPSEFWDWLFRARRQGPDSLVLDSLVLSCVDGEAGYYSLQGSRLTDAAPEAQAERDEQVLAVARGIFNRTSDVFFRDFLKRLIVRGAYKGEPQPGPLNRILFGRERRFVSRGMSLAYRGDLTPELLRLFDERLRLEQSDLPMAMDPVERMRVFSAGRRHVRPTGQSGEVAEPDAPGAGEGAEGDLDLLQLLGLIPGLRRGVGKPDEAERPDSPVRPAEHIYRLRVRLRWMPSVWRVIEILDNQELVDLHRAIQSAFDWDNDHLWAYFMSGKRWDSLTEIASPAVEDGESPFADEVTIGELELKPGQRFLYLLDFGGELHHDVELLEVGPVPQSGDFPRVVEVHGEAPPQYPGLEEEE